MSVSAASATTGAAPRRVSVTADPDRPLATAVLDPANLGGPEAETAYTNLSTGARFVRTFVNWELVAPGGASKPGGFDAKDPGDPAYDWTSLDGQIRMATQKGSLRSSTFKPRPVGAGVHRELDGLPPESERARPVHDGCRSPLLGVVLAPRVRYWQIWNEPNLPAT